MTAAPTLSEVSELLAILQADPARRFVMEDGPRVSAPAYSLYELPADPQGVHALVATIAADSPAFRFLHDAADAFLSRVPTGDASPALSLDPLTRIFMLPTPSTDPTGDRQGDAP